jgi:hypothetical protein
MSQDSFAARYDAALRLAGGRCPIEAGLIGRLADHECRHGRFAFDRTAPCGCWPDEAPQCGRCRNSAVGRSDRRASRSPRRRACQLPLAARPEQAWVDRG